jgi:hypothetical protein
MRRDLRFIVSGVMRRGDRLPTAALFLLALLASGCSGTGLLGTSAPATGAPPASSSPSFTDKISGFFSRSTATSQQSVAGATQDIDCPLINIRPGASTLTIGANSSTASDTDSTNNGAMAVKYQGTFVRAARECALVSGNVVMKVGVEGRIVIGPAGGPGQVDVPLRIAVVEETPARTKPVYTKLIRIPVTVASATDNPTFTDIEEGVTFPMPNDLDNYVVYIGFDPLAAAAQDHPKPAPKAKPKPKAKPTAKTG